MPGSRTTLGVPQRSLLSRRQTPPRSSPTGSVDHLRRPLVRFPIRLLRVPLAPSNVRSATVSSLGATRLTGTGFAAKAQSRPWVEVPRRIPVRLARYRPRLAVISKTGSITILSRSNDQSSEQVQTSWSRRYTYFYLYLVISYRSFWSCSILSLSLVCTSGEAIASILSIRLIALLTSSLLRGAWSAAP
jgi:hypothetical protein